MWAIIKQPRSVGGNAASMQQYDFSGVLNSDVQDGDSREDVQDGVIDLRGRNASPEQLNKALGSETTGRAEGFERQLSREQMERITASDSVAPDVRVATAKNPSLSPEQLERLATEAQQPEKRLFRSVRQF